jgi:hypothetical protein
MTRRNKRGMVVAALFSLGMMAGASREASAGLTLSAGIVQGGGGGQSSDPPYVYEFDIVLNGTISGSGITNTTVTIDNLYGINPGVGYLFYPYDANGPPNGTGWIGSITSVTPVPSPGTPTTAPGGYSDVTWTFVNFGGPISSNGSPIDLGILAVQTSYSGYAANDYSQFPGTASYSYSLNGGTNQDGTVILGQGEIVPNVSAVPEPSSLIAPLVVLAGLPLYRLLKRRDRRA